MISTIRNILALTLVALALAACASHNPYGDPDAQRDRSKDAQDEIRRDTSRY